MWNCLNPSIPNSQEHGGARQDCEILARVTEHCSTAEDLRIPRFRLGSLSYRKRSTAPYGPHIETGDSKGVSSRYAERETETKQILSCTGGAGSIYLVNVRDEFALPWHVHFLIVGSHFALDGKKQHFQVPFFCKSKQNLKKELSYNKAFCCSSGIAEHFFKRLML